MYDFGKHRAIAIGGIGGSGTRKISELLISAGVDMGDDLNSASDNLLSALLFNRRCILSDPKPKFEQIAKVFYSRMSGDDNFSPSDIELIDQIASEDRHQHNQVFLNERKAWLQVAKQGHSPLRRWGWKLPPVHIFIDRFLEIDPTLKYIHLSRSGLDMAFSKNQNQLGTWGPILLNRNVEIGPRDSLSYWCAAQHRLAEIKASYTDRVLQIEFENLCADPENAIREILAFCDVDLGGDLVRSIADGIVVPPTIGRHMKHDLTVLRENDLEYARRVC